MDSDEYDGYDGWQEPMLNFYNPEIGEYVDLCAGEAFTYQIVKASDGSPAPAKPVAGSYRIVVKGIEENGYTGTLVREFTIYKASQAVSVPASYTKFYGDKAFKLPAKRTRGNGKLVFKSSNPGVAPVDSTGTVKIKKVKKAKTVKITVYAAATANYKQSPTKTVTIKVYPKQKTSKAYKKYVGKWREDDFTLRVKVINKNYLHAVVRAKNGDTVTIKKMMKVKKMNKLTLTSKKGKEVTMYIKMKCSKPYTLPNHITMRTGAQMWCEGDSSAWMNGSEWYWLKGKKKKLYLAFYQIL